MMGASRAARRSRALRDAHEDEHDANRWVVSYADFITLLFAFFVVMYSISSVNDGKFRVLSESMVSVFQQEVPMPAPIDLGGGMPGLYKQPGPEEEGSQPQRPFEEVAEDDFPVPVTALSPKDVTAEEIEKILQEPIDLDEVRIRQSEHWIEVELDGEFLFGSGQARLSPAAKPTIDKVAALLRATTTPVRVEGFTDNVPLRAGVYGSNWELSAARAGSVAEAFVKHDIDPARLSATGFGELHPIADNATLDGRKQNRRVVVAIAKHKQVPGASVTLAGTADAPEELPLNTLERVSELPAAEDITL